jgi:hypothetical protein
LVGQLAVGAMAYVVRLHGADLSRALRMAGVEARGRVVRELNRCTAVAGAHLGLAVALLFLADPIGLSQRMLTWAATAAAVLPTLLVLRASAHAEFSGSAGRRASAVAAAVGLACAGVSAVGLVSLAGAPGGVASLLVGIVVQSWTAAWLLRRRGAVVVASGRATRAA